MQKSHFTCITEYSKTEDTRLSILDGTLDGQFFVFFGGGGCFWGPLSCRCVFTRPFVDLTTPILVYIVVGLSAGPI
jgi:hypothetical protein